MEVTMEKYCEHIGINDPNLITDLGLRESKWNGNRAIEIPYFDAKGYEVQTKIRTSLNKSEQRFAWKGHSDPMLYGLQLVPQMEGSTLIFVEGESDVHVATFLGLNAVGVSGNTGFNPDMLDPSLNRFSSFYVLKEKQGGAKFAESFVGSKIESKTKVFDLGEYDDLRDLHLELQDPNAIGEFIRSRKKLAVALTKNTKDTKDSESLELLEYLVPPKPKLPQADPIMFDGLLGDIVKKIDPSTESGIMGLYSHALGYFSHIIGKNPHYVSGYGNFIRVNQYILSVGKSSNGRKGTANASIGHFVREAWDPNFYEQVYGNFGSGEGLIKKLTTPKADEEEDFIPERPTVLLIDEEFESTMTICSRPSEILNGVLLKAFELIPLDRIIANQLDLRANDYWFNQIAHITPKQLMIKFKKDQQNVNRGFYNRYIYFLTGKTKHVSSTVPINWIHNNQNLMELFREQMHWASSQGEIKMSPEAEAEYLEFKIRTSPIDDLESDETTIDIMLARFDRHCISLAMLFYLLDTERHAEIQATHIAQAIAVLDYVDQTIHWLFDSLTGDDLADKLYTYISDKGEVTKSVISNEVGQNNSARIQKINVALLHLIRNQFVEEFEIPSATKPSKAFRIAKHG